jgi:hypothetical protein
VGIAVSAHLAISFRREAYKPGEEISGTVEVLESLTAKALKLTLEYRDWTADYHAVGRAVDVESPVREGDLERGARFPFSVVLPADALPNQSGRLGSTSWGLHARVVRFGPDVNAWQGLVVPGSARSQSPA